MEHPIQTEAEQLATSRDDRKPMTPERLREIVNTFTVIHATAGPAWTIPKVKFDRIAFELLEHATMLEMGGPVCLDCEHGNHEPGYDSSAVQRCACVCHRKVL
jgi:hypothetical protein